MLTNAVIALSAVVATLVVVDFFLSAAQTKWLSDRVLHFWNLVDEAKTEAYIDFITSMYFRIFVVASSVLVTAAVVFAISGSFSQFWQWYLVALSLVVSYVFIRVGLESSSVNWIFIFTSGSAIFLAIVLALIGILVAIGALLLSLAATPASISGVVLYTVASVFLTGALVLGLIVAPVIVAYALTVVLHPVEFLVRRIAEYPKGPVLAISTLCGGVAALFKIFA